MTGLVGIIALLIIIGLSLIITRVATIALTSTGMSEQSARFQARSAFTGTGFTTNEAEAVVNHPVRRRIIMMLMLLRSAGLVTIIISLILSFVGTDGGPGRITRLLIIAVGVGVLWKLSTSKRVDKYVNKLIKKALRKWTDLDIHDYVGLLRLSGEYSVNEMQVREGDWIEGRKLSECNLKGEGVTVLGIIRSDGSYIGGPRGDSEVFADDTLILYGKSQTLNDLDKRRNDTEGERSHEEAVQRHSRTKQSEEQKDRQFVEKRRQNTAVKAKPNHKNRRV